jgi:hypothetical protein
MSTSTYAATHQCGDLGSGRLHLSERFQPYRPTSRWFLVAVFIPTIVLGAVVIGRRQFVAGVLAISVGASGLALLTYIDRTNTMVQYDRWLSRGMPGPHEPSRHENIH